MRGGFFFGLGLSLAVGSAYLQGVFAGLGLPVVDVLSPDVDVELSGEPRVVPGLAVVGGDFDAVDAAVRGPGDAAYGDAASGDRAVVAHGVDAALGNDRPFLRPTRSEERRVG